MIRTIIYCAIWLIAVAYLTGLVVCTCHFHAKFKQCEAQWNAAVARGDRDAQRLYYRAESLAHDDTGATLVWPLVVQRWNVDYVEEAARLLSQTQ